MKKLGKIIVTILITGIVIKPCLANDNKILPCTSLFDTERNQGTLLEFKKDKKEIRALTQNFCDNAYALKCLDNSDWGNAIDYFDASQSAFLTILCNSVWRWTNYNKVSTYLNKSSFIDFNIVDPEAEYPGVCDYSFHNMNDCDYSYNLPLIFNEIMDDFFWIKQARNLWVNKLDIDAKATANTFSKEKFPGITKGICDPDDPNFYYKSTCKTLQWYMVDASNLLKNSNVVNVKTLQAVEADCENHPEQNIFYCGLLWSDSDYKFINTVYNEYFWYKLFLSYYSFYIDGEDYLNTTTKNIADRIEENKEKIFLVQDQLQKSKQAITTSLKTLWEITYSLPIHIWFLMYQEDAQYFMENISKIYPPIRTLYDKLRNVQIQEQ